MKKNYRDFRSWRTQVLQKEQAKETHSLKIKDIVKQIIYKLLFKDNSRKTHVGHL